MSNLIVNQPMTILLTRACMSPAFAAAASAAGAVAPAAVRHNLQAALFAVVVGSNTAACFTVIGSLAGIMWVAIIKQRGLRTTYVQFTRLMLPAGVASTAAALLVLWCEFVFSPY
jgi:Na+/H+ antiporter NhaD/arsenite permease-like protein